MADDKTDVVITQEVKEDYEYVKGTINNFKSITGFIPTGIFGVENNQDSNTSTSWSKILEELNKHIKQNSPEAPLATERYIDYLMYAACFYNDLDLITWLINNGANVNFQEPESGNTLLHLAALHGNVGLAELLIANGADLNYYHHDIKANLQGNTYLHFAADKGYGEFIQFIEKEVALKSVGTESISDIIKHKNKEGNTALHLAAKNGHVECVEEILNNNLYDHDYDQNFHLYHIAMLCVVTVVLSCGASVLLYCGTIRAIEEKSYISLSSLYLVCIICIATPLLNCFYFLYTMENKNSPISVNNDGKTALHLAIKNIQEESDQDQYYQCAQLLIEAIPNSQINIQDKEGNTALHLVAEKGLEKSVEALLKKKANAEIMTNNKETALHLSIENSHYDCALLLAEDINVTKRSWRLKLYKFSITIKNKYDYYINPCIVCLKEKIQEGFQVKKSWEEEALLLAIKHQSKGNSSNERWVFKRELIGQLLEMIDESKIDKVYDYVKDYSQRGAQDGDFVLKKFNNFFRKNEKYKDKNLSRLEKHESWCKDYTLYCSNLSLTILAILFLVKQSFNLSKSDVFVNIENIGVIISKIIAIISFFLAIRLYFTHRELDNLSDYQDKIEEINNLLIKKKEANTNSHIKVQDSNLYKPDHSNRCQNSDQLVLYSDAEEACSSQQQRKNSYTFSKSELSARRQRRAASTDLSDPLLLFYSPVKMLNSLPNKLDKLKQAYQSIKQSFILDIKSTNKLKCKKTSNRELIKNPSFNKFIERETFL